jgi:1,4-alpha-glucan branching enzyme
VDGLRVDAVASMLYRDYSREEFSPNKWGGRENIEACEFLRHVNSVVRDRVPGTAMIAEESTAWPSVSGPTKEGGLGFTYKWNMGWMHDTLAFVGKSPIYRQHHFKDLTFPLVYAFSEHYMLPLSHDEVVHAKGSLWNKMPGFASRKTCNLRLLLAHQFGHPGKKLLFMGGEFGQVAEWNHDAELEWWRLEDPLHKGVQNWVRALNDLYGSHPALWNDGPGGFEWIDFSDVENGVASYLRRSGDDELVFVFNFSIRTHERYRVGLPRGGRWRVLLNSQAKAFHGSGRGSKATLRSSKTGWQWHPNSVVLGLPALGVLVLAPERGEAV